MELWVPVTIAAAFFQNLRSALQKHLKGRLSTSAATYARFLYAWPLALAYVVLLSHGAGLPVPAPTVEFASWCVIGGGAQIVATGLLVGLFSHRNFAVGTAFSKTETVQTAIVGLVLLGDPLTWSATAAILVSLVGVLAISVAKTEMTARTLASSLTERPALMGLASGGLFGVAAVSYRAASTSLGGEGFLMQAAFTLACVLSFQAVVMGVYLVLREPGAFTAVIASWRVSAWTGLAGMLASAGWFTAMTLQSAAYVRALGQIELLFTFAASHLFFGERSNRVEVMGIILVVGGILILLLG